MATKLQLLHARERYAHHIDERIAAIESYRTCPPGSLGAPKTKEISATLREELDQLYRLAAKIELTIGPTTSSGRSEVAQACATAPLKIANQGE